MPKVSSPLKEKFAKRPKQERKPLWDGPESNSPQGGITQSLLSLFLVCRERFRIKVIEGLRPQETWNQRLGYGEMWHICEEAFAKGGPTEFNVVKASQGKNGFSANWEVQLERHRNEQCRKYPLQQEQIVHWYNVCKTQFPIYVRYWAKNTDVVNRTPLLQEQSFNVPYRLPSGRVVYLRGKWDSVDLVKRGRKQVIVLKENKTKGDIDEVQLQQQLTFDLQTMTYLVALQNVEAGWDNWTKKVCGAITPLAGVNYNVVRRPLSGGIGSIVQGKGTKGAKCGLKCCRVKPDRDCPKCGGVGRVGAKPPETDEEYYGRLRGIIDGSAEGSPGPGYFFMRWNVDISPHDVEKFKREFLDPCLEHLCVWYDQAADSYKAEGTAPGWSHIHYRTPFGLYNPLAEGGATDVDSYLTGGGNTGLVKAETLFRELE